MLDTIVSAIIDTISAAGVRCERRYPQKNMRLDLGPLVCVGIKKSKAGTSGIGEYLGLRSGEEGDTELYGLRLEATACLDIFSAPGSGGIKTLDECFVKLCRGLNTLPAGLKLKETHLGQTAFDKSAEAFLMRVELVFSAYITCELDEDSGQFSDFELKGVLRNVY